MPRLTNDALSRILHNGLYTRMVAFCNEFTPELPAEPIVTHWINRLFNGDDNLHILVNLDNNYTITGHVIIDVQEVLGYKVVYCHQAQIDKAATGTIAECMEYIDKLTEQIGATCSVFTVGKNTKVFEKKHGYKTIRTIMMKCKADETE